MKKTKLITGGMLLIITMAMAVVAGINIINTFSEQKVVNDTTAELLTDEAEVVLKSANATPVLTQTDIDGSKAAVAKTAEDSDSTIVVESNNSVKITKNKTKKKNKKSKKNKKKKSKTKCLGTYKVTAYCGCSRCCGKSTGITASGAVAKAGRTVAADTSTLPFGTQVVIDGHTYTVEDKGGSISGNRIDIYFSSHSEALAWGVRYCKVYVKK